MLMAKTCKIRAVRQEQKQALVPRCPLFELTLSPLSDLMSIIVSTVSYRIALPTFLLVSVFVATCKCKDPIWQKTIQCMGL